MPNLKFTIQSDVGISPTLNKTNLWERGHLALVCRGQDALAPRLLAHIPHHIESNPNPDDERLF